MKRIVFSAVGSLGDVHPYVAIGRKLLARGHEAIIATTDRHQPVVEQAGLAYAPLRPSEKQFGGLESVAERLFDPWNGPGYLIREMVMPFVREQYEDISLACEGADALVTHPLTLTGPLVCERRGLPWVSSVLAPASLMSAIDRPLVNSAPWAHALRHLGAPAYRVFLALAETVARRWEHPLHALRAGLGLPPARHAALFRGQFSPRLNLALFPRIIAEPAPDWPPNTVLTGVPRYDGTAMTAGQRAELGAFLSAGDPPIVFALGSSVVMFAGDFWDKAIDAATALGRRAILLTGTPLAGALPGGIKAFDYLPYSEVFPRAAAIVHQAGIGTLTQALAAGRPQLIVPVAFDQPDNARRAKALGVARVLPMRKVTAGRLAGELATLLSEPAYRSSAASAKAHLDDGSDLAAGALLAAIS